jgi:hypothetical protein
MPVPAEEEVRFLSWAIGGLKTFDPSAALDTEKMLSLSFEHRVAGRLLARIRTEQPKWATKALSSGLETQQGENARFFDQQKLALSSVRDRYFQGNDPIIVLKGIGYFARTKDEATLRRAFDLDIMVKSPDILVTALRRDRVQEYRNVSPHELINAKVDGMEIDLHGYYPIWRTENVTGEWQTQGANQGGPYRHSGEVIVSKLDFQAIADHAQPAGLFGTDGIYVPSPASAIVIICAHSFRDYISRSSVTMRTKAPVRFAEIAEIGDYLSLPEFSSEEFLDLVRRFHAHQAVSWMAQFVAFHANDNRLASLVGVVPGKADEVLKGFPRAVWTGFFATIPASLSDFANSPAVTSRIIETMNGKRFELSNDTPIIVDLNQGSLESTEYVHVLAPPNTGSPAIISLSLTHNLITIDINARVLGRGILSRVHVDIANFPWEWNWDRERDKITSKRSGNMPEPITSFQQTSDGFRLCFSIDVSALGLLAREEIPGFVALGELKDGLTIRAGTLFPFVLQRMSPADD